MPEITVKIATLTANYNKAPYIIECLDSILKQTRRPNIIMVVDDASTDDSWATLLNWLYGITGQHVENSNDIQLKWNGIEYKFIRHDTNSGPAKARNTGLKYLIDKTDAICIVDSDDVLYPDKLSKSIATMFKYPHVGLVYSDYDIYNQTSGVKNREFKEVFSFDRLSEECIVSNNSLISTNVIKEVGLYDESLFGPEDYDMWLRISEISAIYHIPESLYMYRISGTNITMTTPTERFADHVRRVYQKTFERRNGQKQ